MCKVPATKTRQLAGGRRQHKVDTSWVKGIWVGKRLESDEHVIMTMQGKVHCRTVRRLPPSGRADKQLLAECFGAP